MDETNVFIIKMWLAQFINSKFSSAEDHDKALMAAKYIEQLEKTLDTTWYEYENAIDNR
jgi:DUF971 family protein